MSLQPGMTLFVEAQKGSRYFHVEYAQVSYPIFPGHASAFKDAAEMLIEHHLSQTFNNDSLVFPVLALYRHSVELALKDLVRLGLSCDTYDDADLAAILGAGHRLGRDAALARHELNPLWCHALKIINGFEEADERAVVAGELINQFHEIDEGGQTLRYDRDARTLRLDRERFQNMPQVIGIVNLRTVANALFDYLESWSGYIRELRSNGP